MPTRFSRDEVLRIAALARLELDEQDVARFAAQLTDILAYAEIVRQVDTSDVAPTSHALGPAPAAWREDLPSPSLDRDDVLAAAPDADRRAGLFRVPKVL
jgi:aspartyl-tRNA(Asn)/glutamyl-tRNA(Gln) amidotransferase subunit C